MSKGKNLLILTTHSPDSFSPAGERVRFTALASGKFFERTTIVTLDRSKKQINSQVTPNGNVWIRRINFSRAMPYPFLALFDPMQFFVLLFHGFAECVRDNPAFIIASMPPLETGLASWVLAKLFHTRLVVDLRDDWELATRSQLRRFFPVSFFRLLSTIAERLYSSTVVMFAVTQIISDSIHGRGVKQPILLVPNGADTSIFRPLGVGARTTARIDGRLPRDKIIVIYCGSGDNPYYRLDTVLASVSLLPEHVRRRLFFVFYVYNGQKYLNQLRHRFDIPQDTVEVRDPIPRRQLASILPACDVGLVPFDSKPYLSCARSTKMYEYLSCGLYVVSSGPRNGELDSFFHVNPNLGSFTWPAPSDFAQAFTSIGLQAEKQLDEPSRQMRYEFIRMNYDRRTLMKKALSALFTQTAPTNEEV